MNTTKKTRSGTNPVYNTPADMKISKNKITLALVLLISGIVTAQTPCTVTPSSDKNYVTTEILQKEETVEGNLAALKAPDKMTSVQYLDGLGRPLQTIQVNASTSLKDNVVFNVYDFAGRENKAYLPYTSSGCGTYISNALTAQSSFYNTTANIETTAYPFAETVFEPSPLNRVTTQGAAGADWQISGNHTVKYDYGTNAYQEVRNYLVLNTTIFYYAPNTLFKKIIKDENWVVEDAKNGTTEEFTDVEGQLILKRTYTNNLTYDTYYVYNSYGNLMYVIPPAARMTLVTGPVTASPVLNNLCYQYTYDNYNRMTGKKLPGKDWEYIAYDQLDRPVFTQDGNLRLQNKWLFTKYDAFGKVAYTGIYNSSATLQILQDQLNQKAAGFVGGTLYPLYETRLTTPINMDGKDIYYSNTALPTTNLQLLSINYYDNYAFDLDGLTVPTSVYGTAVTSQLTGMLTGTKVRVIEDVPTGYWTTTLMAYDSKARTVCASVQNRYTGYTQKEEFKLDFTGKSTETTTTHTKGTAAPIVVIDQMSYDAAGRLSGHGEKINSQVTERIGTNSYNELGQLITKYIGNSTSTSTHLQQLNYTYNIRGWLKQLNNTSSMGTDLFAYTLSYNSTQLTGSKAMYNGNISEASWKTTNDNLLRSYNYHYDKLNRITAANSLNTGAGRFSNTGITYDYNGNIMTMTRNGWQNSTTNFSNLDVLTYAYDGNKLLSVTDAGNKNYGFIDGNTSGNDYFYADMNGNLTQDKNKNITSIAYNYMNLPQTIVTTQGTSNTGTISYAYDANGVKQRKMTVLNGPGIRPNPYIVEYAGNYVYEGNLNTVTDLQYFNQIEGYVRPITVGSQTYQYVYQYRDHLGNNRLSYTDDDPSATVHLTVIEESNYDAFGLKHQGYNNVISSLGNSRAQALKYNGKELQDDYGLNWYDYGARFYDPAIGRWHVMDPLAEKGRRWSPYNYCMNNPVRFIDPDGRWPDGPPSPLSVTANFFKGVGESAVGTVVGAYNMVRHPINTAKAIYNAVGDPTKQVMTTIAVGNAVAQGYEKFKSGDANVKANMIGKVGGDIAQLAIGAGEVKAAINGIKEVKAVGEVAATAETSVLSGGEFLRIENAATRIDKPITVVGSRASGTAGAYSDWDYVIENLNSKDWSKIKNSLPGSSSTLNNTTKNIDIFKGPVNPALPNITINPR
jgi:RHS repeat-associated protein